MTSDTVDVFAYDCPLCWDTGVIVVMEPGGSDGRGVERKRRCPEGCLVPDEVPF